jgi:aspartate-semialdehyde dehydrogenase
MNAMHIAIVGATGAVGSEALSLLEKSTLPIKQLRCFASVRSLGKTLSFRGQPLPVEELTPSSFSGCDFALLCAGGKISKAWAPCALERGATVIDCSSFFRMDPKVPLIIPEINAHALKPEHRLIASPNCSTTIMLMALAPLHRISPIKRIVATTYQAASGAGAQAMIELQEETRAFLEGMSYERSVMPYPYAFNLFTHNSALTESGYVEEELKMCYESQKILEAEVLINATCVRVPVLRAHSIALNVCFHAPLSAKEAYALIEKAPGIEILEDRKSNRFPMPIDAMGKENVYCGRIREDRTQPNTLDLWVVGDQLLKGAALNAIQILNLRSLVNSSS